MDSKINFLLESVSEDFSDLMQFNLVPKYQSYIHLVGAAKKNIIACKMVEQHLQYEYPDYYKKISQIFHADKQTSSIPYNRTKTTDSFSKTENIIKYFNRNKNKDVDVLSDQIKQITTSLLDNSKKELIKSIFEFEKTQYELDNKYSLTFGDESSFSAFHKAKKFLTANDKNEILSNKYVLANPLEILVLPYNIPELTSQDHWIEQLLSTEQNYQAEEYIFLFIKEAENRIKSLRLIGSDQLLYYFSNEPISGNELIDILIEDKTNNVLKSDYQDAVFNFLSMSHLRLAHFSKSFKLDNRWIFRSDYFC